MYERKEKQTKNNNINADFNLLEYISVFKYCNFCFILKSR